MEGEIPIETDKIEGTDEEWKGFREFSEKVSRKLNRRIVMLCGVVFLICMMLTVALYSDSFQSYHLSRIAAEDIKVEEVYQLKNGRLYVHVKSKRRITGPSYPQTDIDTDTNTVAGKDAVGAVREPKNSVIYGISMNSSINPFARVMYITSKEVAYVIPFEDGQIITDNGTKASEFDYVGRSGEKKILWQENDEVKKAVLNAVEYYKKLGCEIVDVSLPSLEYAVSAYYLISSAEAASNLSRFDGIKYGLRSGLGEDFNDLIKNSRREGFGQEVKRRIMLGNYALCSGYYDAYYKNATRIRTQIRNEYADIFSKCDVMLTPTAPTTAYKIGEQENDPVKMYLADIYTVTVNIAGLPAISTTCGYDSKGLPIGMSLIGKAFDEKTIIAVCDRFEKDFERKEIVL